MKNKLGMALAAIIATMSIGAAGEASAAITLLSPTSCDITNIASGGCRFSTPGNEHKNIDGIIAEYNAKINPDITDTLTYLGKAEKGKVVGADDSTQVDTYLVIDGKSWTFDDLPFDVAYFTVKSAQETILFKFTPGSDPWTAFNTSIKNQNNKLQDISHVSFYGAPSVVTPVPEPATWAMMIIGFGGIGAILRQRRRLASASVAA